MRHKDLTDFTKEGASYTDDPEKFCQAIYEEAQQRVDDLREINETNRLFYEGIDEELRSRGKNSRVKRSALHIHEMTPAIDTRISDVVSRVEENNEPLFVRANFGDLTPVQRDQKQQIERQLNLDLRESGYLTDVFREHITASEIYRSPSAVKVGWGRGHRMMPEAIFPSDEEIQDAVASNKPIPIPRVRFVKKEISGPFVEWLPPDQFLYEPNRSDFFRTSRYSIHATWMSWDELFATAEEQNWNMKKIRDYKDGVEGDGGGMVGSQKDTHQEAIDKRKGTGFREGFKDNKVLVTENYIIDFDPIGREKVNLAVMVGNEVLVFNKPSVYMAIKFPFVPIVANRLPGTIEGLSSVDRVKELQRLFNEIFNSWIDAITYRIFPPFKKMKGNTFDSQPIYGPGEIWNLTDPEGLTPVIENIGDLPDLAQLMVAVSAKIRQTLGAPDINQGFQSQQYEKATSTRLRAQGAARRSSSTYKNYGNAIVKVSEMFLALNQQFHDDPTLFVMDVSLDVPSLTNVLDPQQEQESAIFFNDLLKQEPMYNDNKIGMEKRRALIDHIGKLLMRREGERFVLNEEEFNSILETQQAGQQAVVAEEAAMQDAQAISQSVPQGVQ